VGDASKMLRSLQVYSFCEEMLREKQGMDWLTQLRQFLNKTAHTRLTGLVIRIPVGSTVIMKRNQQTHVRK
jgi:hypothetical protein